MLNIKNTHVVVFIFFLSSIALFTTKFSFIAGTTRVLFSPDDKPAQHLIKLINNAQSKIHAAVYMLTNKKIANALVGAKRRQVDVQIITDQSCLESKYNHIGLLKRNAISVFVYPAKKMHNGKQSTGSLMHHKFALIDRKVWTGSFNWTHSANIRNQENVTVIDDPAVYARYAQQFERVKRRCFMHQTPKKKKIRRQSKRRRKRRSTRKQTKKRSRKNKPRSTQRAHMAYLLKRIRERIRAH